MRVCAGIVSWQDGPALANAVGSVRDVCDEIVIVDGLIEGIDPHGLPALSNYDELRRYTPHVEQGRWASQSAQRQRTLEFARDNGCDWLLAIDADEQLENASALRAWLAIWHWDAFPLPFWVTEGQVVSAAFKCLHVPSWRRYVCQGNILESSRGELVQLIGQTQWTRAREAKMPYLSHHPELRPEARRSIRLSEHETLLEPYPPGVKGWLEPTHSPLLLSADGEIASLERAAELGMAIFYCPGCGRRYAGPGSCSRQHETLGLEPLHIAHGRRSELVL